MLTRFHTLPDPEIEFTVTFLTKRTNQRFNPLDSSKWRNWSLQPNLSADEFCYCVTIYLIPCLNYYGEILGLRVGKPVSPAFLQNVVIVRRFLWTLEIKIKMCLIYSLSTRFQLSYAVECEMLLD